MNNDNLKIARDRISGQVSAENDGKPTERERKKTAIEKARKREINKQIFRA